MENMNWKESNKMPKESYGWFAVAVLPRNHSGVGVENLEDLESDNNWRKKFGFTKAWLNGNQWYEPDPHGYRSRNITSYVTHWDYLPEVPILEKPFPHSDKWRLSDKISEKEISELAEKERSLLKEDIVPKDFIKGFKTAFKILGF